MLKQRILTAVILIPLVFAAIFYTSPLVFRFVLAAILLGAALEWTTLMGLSGRQASKENFFSCAAYLFLLAGCFYLAIHFSQTILIKLGAIWWILVTYWLVADKMPRILVAPKKPSFRAFFIGLIGVLIFTSCFSAINFLHDYGQIWLVLLLIIVWLADIAAYFVGRGFGKHLLVPHISPKKTWEGVGGGLLTVLLAVLVGAWMVSASTKQAMVWSLLGVLTASISIVGDLFESLLKRQVGVKDSGQLLPGHGGLLDRIDSLLAAAPFFALWFLMLRLLWN